MLGAKTILSLMDEALYIYSANAGKMSFIDAVPWKTEHFADQVVAILKEDCKNRPVVILNDMVEQHYRKERVLTSGVGVMDRKAMVDRKLNMAFPGYAVRAALPLKEKITKEAGKNTSDVFIFAAVPDTAQLKAVVKVIQRSNVGVSGFGLLPVESAGLVTQLVKKICDKDEQKSAWNMLIVQHKNGGLRQIVTRNGEIALTRMTPVVDSDQDPQQWASEVLQEFRATMSYLTRFGFQVTDGLNIILIGNEMSGQIFAQAIDERLNVKIISPDAAAKAIGLSIEIQENSRYGDILHMAWAAKKTSLTLPLSSKAIQNIAMPRLAAKAASILLILSAGFLIYQSATGLMTLNDVSSQYTNTKSKYAKLNAEYEEEVKKKEALGIDIRLIQSSIAVHNDLENKNMRFLDLMRRLSMVMAQEDLRADTILVKVPVDAGSQASGNARLRMSRGMISQKKRIFEAVLQIEYPTLDERGAEEGNREIAALVKRMQEYWPTYKVTLQKELLDYQYVNEITASTNSNANNSAKVEQDFIAEIKIEGPEING